MVQSFIIIQLHQSGPLRKQQKLNSQSHTHVALPHRVAKVTENQTWRLIHCKLAQTFASNFEEFKASNGKICAKMRAETTCYRKGSNIDMKANMLKYNSQESASIVRSHYTAYYRTENWKDRIASLYSSYVKQYLSLCIMVLETTV